MARNRNDFTSSDDEHLKEYIAQWNPEPRGRQGNRLYQNLEENAGNSWPWSVNHPWQSWRERYKKNQDWFDYHIKRYLKKQRRATREVKKQSGQEEEENAQRREDKPDSKPKPKSTKASAKSDEKGQPKTEKVIKNQELEPTVAQRGDEMVQKPRDATVAPREEPRVEKAARKEKSKDTASRHEERVRPEEARQVPSAKASHTEEVPDSEHASPEVTQDKHGLSDDDLMLELFGPSDEEDDAGPPAGDVLESQQPKSPFKKKVVDDTPSAPKSSLSSEPVLSQYPPRSSVPTKSHHLSQEPTPPKSTADHSTAEKSRSRTPSPSYPAPTPAQRPPKSPQSSSPPPAKSKKPKLKPKKKAEKNIFESPPSTPSPGPDAVTPKRDLVTVVEGPFRTTLKRPRQARHDSDSDGGRRWPPKRSKTIAPADAATKPVEVEEVTTEPPPRQSPAVHVSSIPKPAVIVQTSPNQAAQRKARRQRPLQQQVNAIASSSKVKLPDPHTHDAHPTHFISDQRQEEEQVSTPQARQPEQEPPKDDTITGHKASIPIQAQGGQVQAIQAQSKVEVHDQTTTMAITNTNTKDPATAKERQQDGEGKLHAIIHSHMAWVETDQHPVGLTVNSLAKPPIVSPITVPVPAPVPTTNVPPIPSTLGHARLDATPTLVSDPRTSTGSTRAHTLPTKPAQANDPFISSSANVTPRPNVLVAAIDKGKARASDPQQEGQQLQPERPYVLESKLPRKIDLHRQSLSKPKPPRTSVSLNSSIDRPTSALSRRESLLSTRSRTSTTSTSSNALLKSRLSKSRLSVASSRRSTLSIADLEEQLEPEEGAQFTETAALETAAVLKELADTYGVSVKIAIKTYIRNGTLEETEHILQQFYIGLADLEKQIYTRLPGLTRGNGDERNDDEEDEEESPEGLILNSHRASNSTKAREDGQTPQRQSRQSMKSASASVSPRRQSIKSTSASPKRPRTSMMAIKPLSAEDDVPLSDYSPPNSSRAGQFARLEKQGRRDEALAREKRRASGVHVVSTQVPNGREVQDPDQERQSSLVNGFQNGIEDVSPSPHDRRVAMASMQMELEVHRDEGEPEPAPAQNTYMQSDDDDMYAHTDDEFAQQMGETEDKNEVVEVEPKSSPAKARQIPNVDEEMGQDAMGTSPSHPIPSPEPRSSKSIHDLIDEMESANPKVARKHRALAFNVTQENEAKMRKFEAANDPKLLRYLSIKWVEEFIKDGVGEKETPGSAA